MMSNRSTLTATLVCSLAFGLGSSGSAFGAFQGENGRLAALVKNTAAGLPCGDDVGHMNCGHDDRIVTFGSDGRRQRQVARHVTVHSSDVIRDPVWSPDGRRLAFLRGTRPVVMNADGSHRRALRPGRLFYTIAWAADGRHLLLGGPSGPDANESIYRVRADGRKLHLLTNGNDSNPSASSSGAIAFERRSGGTNFVYVIPPGEARPRRVLRGEDPDLSPGGRRLVFARGDGLYTASISGRGVRQITNGHTNIAADHDRQAAWSPDGSRIAFVRESGIYTVRADGRRVKKVPVRTEAATRCGSPATEHCA